MTQYSSFLRKVVYGGAIVVLLFPLFLLGQPAIRSATRADSEGGKLARLRSDFGLSQAELGKIDPASETMKMATLGLRGVATNLLWTKAVQYKKTENWDRLAATLNQIAKLEPNYITVWEYQAHNMSYNVSVEFDNYRDRYHWVKKGIDFLIEGTRYNRHNPRLLWTLGWFTGHKFGRSDEYVQFRRMFRKDRDFHDTMVPYINIERSNGPDGYPDNWLVAYLWYLESQAVAEQGIPITWLRLDPSEQGLTNKRRSAVIFYSDPPMSLINYAEAITEEITPGEITRYSWKEASDKWREYGNMDIPTTFGHTVRLATKEQVRQKFQDLTAQLAEMAPGLRDEIYDQRWNELSPEAREAVTILKECIEEGVNPLERLDETQIERVRRAESKLTVSEMDLAEAMPEELRPKARRLAYEAMDATMMGQRISTYCNVVNYEYWDMRCEVEATKTTADARRYMMLGRQADEIGDPEGARENFEKAWDEWALIFDQYPQLIHKEMGGDLEESIQRYRRVLDQLDEEFPEDFKLQALVDAWAEDIPGLPPDEAGATPPTGQGGTTPSPEAFRVGEGADSKDN